MFFTGFSLYFYLFSQDFHCVFTGFSLYYKLRTQQVVTQVEEPLIVLV